MTPPVDVSILLFFARTHIDCMSLFALSFRIGYIYSLLCEVKAVGSSAVVTFLFSVLVKKKKINCL